MNDNGDTVSITIEKIKTNDQEISIESGKWAKQAHGSIVYRSGSLVLLATVCSDKKAKEGQSFLPLTVEYREKFYAAGRIPGGYFKRESRLAEHETLMSRIIDRPCRPLFPEGYYCEIQLLVTMLSYDPNQSVEGHAITAASAALMVSDVPWAGPIAGCYLACVDGEFIVDPSQEQRDKSNLGLLISASKDAITMIEGSADEYSNDEMIRALEFAQTSLADKLKFQEKLAKSLAVKKYTPSLRLPDQKIIEEVDAYAYEKMELANQTMGKEEREASINKVCEDSLEYFKSKLEADSRDDINQCLTDIKNRLHHLEYLVVRALIFEKGLRADKRKSDEIRDISVEVDVLPGAHGSAVFTRGQTQSLGVVTLGTKMDNQRYDSIEGLKFKNFLLHYNFPPFSVGEVRRVMGPGRRELGHGNLALRALSSVLPTQEDFPYVVRVVSEILESNGSSSMASVCSGSLSMMSAGVPIKSAVAGIAMGLMSNDKGEQAVLSDIAGLEDHFGDMDLKVARTEKGITAFQMDLKIQGIGLDTLKISLEQAEKGCLHILKEMNKVCAKPRGSVAEGAPRIDSLSIDSSRIGEMIGPGGRIIRDIMEKSGAEVNVDDDGSVMIASNSSEANEKAKKMINDLFRELKTGDDFDGTVKRVTDYGAFVELIAGKEALLHVSKMSNERIESVSSVYSEGDKVPVVILGVDKMGRIDLRHRDFTPNPDDDRAARDSRGPRRDNKDSRYHGGRSRDNSRSRDDRPRFSRDNNRDNSRSRSDRDSSRAPRTSRPSRS